MGRQQKICKICKKVQAVLDQDEPVGLAECNTPNQATCQRNLAGHDVKMRKQAKKNKMALAEENKAGPGVDGLADLDGMKVPELKAICKSLGLSAYSSMNKKELIDLIFQASRAGAAN